MKLTTTLNKIRACSPCGAGWQTLLKHVGKDFNPDAEINLLTVLESNGVADMLWALRAIDQDSKRIASQLAIEFAEQALPIFETRRPNDTRPRDAIQAARDYLDGKISTDELQACQSQTYAGDAFAGAAAAAADAAAYAFRDAADAADAIALADASTASGALTVLCLAADDLRAACAISEDTL